MGFNSGFKGLMTDPLCPIFCARL